MVAKITALALSMAAAIGMTPIATPALAPGLVVSMPQQQAPAKVAPTVMAARDEVERVDEVGLFIHRHRRQWDGKNRTSGDRAHKRWKRSRASGRG